MLVRSLLAATAGVPSGIRASLLASLAAAEASLAQGNVGAAVNRGFEPHGQKKEEP